MTTQNERRVWILGAAVVAIILWAFPGSNATPMALGGTVDSAGGYTLATGRLQSRGEADALYIWNHKTQKLAVYLITGRNLEVLAVRDCTYDFAVPGYSPEGGQQVPKPSEMRKASQKTD